MTIRTRGRRHVADLERVAASTQSQLGDLRATIAGLTAAFDTLPVGVIVHGAGGDELVRNRIVKSATGDRQADALLTGAVEDMRARAAVGPNEQVLELHQPRRTYRIASHVLPSGGTVVMA